MSNKSSEAFLVRCCFEVSLYCLFTTPITSTSSISMTKFADETLCIERFGSRNLGVALSVFGCSFAVCVTRLASVSRVRLGGGFVNTDRETRSVEETFAIGGQIHWMIRRVKS